MSTKRTAALSLTSQLHLSRSCLSSAPLTFTHKSLHLSRTCLQLHFCLSIRSHFTSQESACKCTFDFHSQVTSLLSSSHSGRLANVARVSFVVQSSCSCELNTAIRCHTSCCTGRPLWAGFCSLRGTVAAQLLPIGAARPVGQDTLMGWDQLFPIFLWHKFSS